MFKSYEPTKEEAIKAVEEAITINGDYLFERFQGKNCDELDDTQCAGWESPPAEQPFEGNRCICTNRRVSWEFEKDTNSGEIRACPVAY